MTKRECKWFTISQYEEEAVYLREMHKQGWRLTKVTFPCFYTFEQCAPEDVVYQLDYNQEGIQQKAEYRQMFADCGWEYMFDFVGYSYFRKPAAAMQGEEEIFCDDESRLEMLKRVIVGRLLPLLILFCGVVIPQLMMNLMRADTNIWAAFFVGVYVAILVLYIAIFARMGYDYLKLIKRIKG